VAYHRLGDPRRAEADEERSRLLAQASPAAEDEAILAGRSLCSDCA
jgi:hypothetical protein